MPDIAMCTNLKCDLSSKCYRFMAKPEMLQSYLIISKDVKTEKDCDHFWRMEEDEISSMELQKAD